MKISVNRRLAALGLAVGMMGAAIVVLIVDTERRANVTRAQLGEMDLESFQIADRFKEKLRQANDQLRRYGSADDHAAWNEFLEACQELKSWIGQQAPHLNTDEEHEALKRIQSAYKIYMQRAQELHARIEGAHEAAASLAEYNGFFEESRRFLDLGQDLARAHFDYRNQVLARATRTITELRWSAIGSLGLLFLFGLGLAGVVYRDLIAPLRVKLQESQVVAERNEKLAALGLLAAGVAHEIRNPLTALKTALFLQQRKLTPGALEPGDNELLEREILRLERIVNEFLQFARPAQPHPIVITANEPLQHVQSLLAPQLADSSIRLISEPGVALSIKVDPAQIQQVLINLVQNSADSIGRNGTITLRARPEHRRLGDTEREVVILEVTDTGKGIPPAVQKRLFDPFFTTKEKGTGLGLSIASRIVEMNGGVLQFQTQQNRGSTFGIVLPQASTPATKRQEPVLS
jgi:signal transduction histidine kinase